MNESNRKFAPYKFRGLTGGTDYSKISDGRTPDCKNVAFVSTDPMRLDGRPGARRSGTEQKRMVVWYNPADGSETMVPDQDVEVMWYANLDGTRFQLTKNLTDGYGVVWGYDSIGATARYVFANDTLQIEGKSLGTFLGRIYLGGARFSFTSLLGGSSNRYVNALGATATSWVGTGVTLATRSLPGGVTRNVIVPGASSGNRWIQFDYVQPGSLIGGATGKRSITWLSQLANESATTICPMTCYIYYGIPITRNTLYAAGQVGMAFRPDLGTGNGYKYRLSVSGTTGGAAPVWPTTVGTSVVDGSATWVCDGPDVAGSSEISLLGKSITNGEFQSLYTTAISENLAGFGLRLQFGNSTYTSWPVDGVAVGLRDGLADGAEGKNCKGQQVTQGSFKHEFINLESSDIYSRAYGNRVIWSEFRSDKLLKNTYEVRASNYWDLTDHVGDVTAVIPFTSRVIFSKLNSMFIFSGTADPNLPLNLERVVDGVGCRGNHCFDYFGDSVYVLGENDVFEVSPDGNWKSLCDAGVREKIFDRGSDWYESQTVYASPLLSWNVPLLAIDKKRKLLFVYTQRRKLFVMSLENGEWSKWGFTGLNDQGGGLGYAIGDDLEIYDMVFAEDEMWFTLGKIYTAGHATCVYYLDDSLTQDSSPGNFTPYQDTDFLPVEMYYDIPVIESPAPKRDVLVESIDLHHQISVDAEMTVKISRDGGATFPQSNSVTLTASNGVATKTDRIDVWQTSDSLQVRLYKLGEATKAGWRMTQADVAMQLLSDDDNMEYPVSSTSSNL